MTATFECAGTACDFFNLATSQVPELRAFPGESQKACTATGRCIGSLSTEEVAVMLPAAEEQLDVAITRLTEELTGGAE